jgi:inorganic pyrophosphatase
MRDSFWKALDELVASSRVVIDRPKGSTHPRFADVIYPLDYGYLDGTSASDGNGIDVWIGTGNPAPVTGAICTVDSQKRDSEIKVLLGCSEVEMKIIVDFFQRHSIGCLLVRRASIE